MQVNDWNDITSDAGYWEGRTDEKDKVYRRRPKSSGTKAGRQRSWMGGWRDEI